MLIALWNVQGEPF